jgi:hypothetical protein
MSKITINREAIGPKLAASYLEKNPSNRPLSQKRVATFQQAIKRGEWQENGETIKFNGDGTLLDGQHRLAAIVACGSSPESLRPLVWCWVVRGLSTESQETMDTGGVRTVGMMLAIRGVKNANEVATAARMVWSYRETGEADTKGMQVAPTAQQVLAVVESEPSLQEWVQFGRTVQNRDPSLRISKSVVAGFSLLFAEVSSDDDARAFFNQLIVPLHQTDATAVLRLKLLQQGFHNQIPSLILRAFVIKGWNHWINGERPARITWRAGGAKREAFPVIRGPLDEVSS